jgi:cellulose synthase/poly-beta-1,6-N-acetylglucosamine synthase-like glycosyltransferase
VSVGGWLLVPATLLLAIVIPALAYTLIDGVFPGTLPLLQYAVASAYALTATMTLLEARAALGSHDDPPTADIDDPLALAELPTVTAIVSAYLPNERELVADTIVHLATELRVAPGSLQIILAYNTPEDMPDVEAQLASLAQLHTAFTPLRVRTSRSKSENVNAAMGLIHGEVTVLLDADHRPARDAAVRALRWFDAGYDIVQGRCVIRDHDANWLSRIIAVEFEQIYAVSHAGRSLAFDTAMFCGTNGWWRTSVLRQIGMDDQMLTEDIDSSVRALLAGHRTIHDRSIISTELAPPTPKAWWGQRMRWAQGWFQVTLKHQAAIVRSPRLSTELKLYWTYLLGWRELFPVLSLQIFALLLANVLAGREFSWFYDPFLVITTVLTLVAGPLAAVMTYRVALETQRRELRRWFFIYAAGSLVYTTAKNTVAMVATVRELLGQRGWIVTRRAPVAPARAAQAATTAVLALLAATAIAASAPTSAQAAPAVPAEMTTLKLAPLATSMQLTGRTPVTSISVPVPQDWATAGGTLRLRWQGSPSVAPTSTLRVIVNDVLLAATPVDAGRGGVNVTIAAQRVPAHRLDIRLAGQLHSRVDSQCCVPDAATRSIVALDAKATSLTLTGRRASTKPLLADLPDSLVDVTGTRAAPLFLALPAAPSEDTLRAAAVMAGAVARAGSGTTVPIQVVRGATPQRMQALPGQVVELVPRGKPRVALVRRPDGRLILTLGGQDDGVLRAAWAFARKQRPFLSGSRAAITTGLASGATGESAVKATITPSSAEGTGQLRFNVGFRLPQSRELTDGKLSLELDLGFSAPAGGHVEIGLNGQPLATRNLPKQGAGQRRIAIDLFQDPVDAPSDRLAIGNLDIPPGDNFLTVSANLPAGQPVGGAGDALVPELRLLPSSTVRFSSQERPRRPILNLWPWPFRTTDAMAGTTFLLPADPTPSELSWAIGTIAEASRYMTAPAAPKIAVGPGSLPPGDLVVLTRGLTPPVALPAGAPEEPRLGLLQTYASHGRQLLVAYGTRALRPLASDYHSGKVKGVAAIVAADGDVTTVKAAPPAPSFQEPPLPWKIPAAILVFCVLLVVGLRMRSVRRRLQSLPAPVPAAPLDDAAVRAQLDEWERLVTHDAPSPRS